jgi:hypothetical protein
VPTQRRETECGAALRLRFKWERSDYVVTAATQALTDEVNPPVALRRLIGARLWL